jgi:hypothetical protein
VPRTRTHAEAESATNPFDKQPNHPKTSDQSLQREGKRMLSVNALFFLVLLATGLRNPRHMEWLSASVTAMALSLLALLAEASVHRLVSADGAALPERMFCFWFAVAAFVSAKTAAGDAVRAARRRLRREMPAPGQPGTPAPPA